MNTKATITRTNQGTAKNLQDRAYNNGLDTGNNLRTLETHPDNECLLRGIFEKARQDFRNMPEEELMEFVRDLTYKHCPGLLAREASCRPSNENKIRGIVA